MAHDFAKCRSNIMIYCSDPAPQNIYLKKELEEILASFIDSGQYIKGPNCRLFEERFSNYIGVDYALGVANATDALEISLKALGIQPGDDVLTTSLTAVATACAIKNVGANVIFVDTESTSLNIDPFDLELKITEKAKAVIAVHLHGNPCQIETLRLICDRHGLFLLEDCSQAHGAEVNGKKVGSIGDVSCFSFYPTKNLAALGDGGAILTNDFKLYDKCLELHQYGWKNRISVSAEGRNSRLDELQAGFLNLKLQYLDHFNQQRKDIANEYIRKLCDTSVIVPQQKDNEECVYHQFVVRSPDRDKIMQSLKKRKIFCGIHYEVPVHQQPNFYKSNVILKNTEKQATEILSLPIYPGLSIAQVEEITSLILELGV